MKKKYIIKILIILLVCFFCCGLANAENKPSKSKLYQQYIEQAQKYEEEEKINEAKEAYEKAHKLYPLKLKPMLGIFRTSVGKLQSKLEIKYFEEGLKEKPNDIYLLEDYARYLRGHKNYDKTLEIYNRLYNLTKNKKYKIAVSEINALKKNEQFSEYYNKAIKYESKSKIAEANKYYLKAHNVLPQKFEARFGLAKTYGWLGKHKQASEHYKALVKDYPKNEKLLKAFKDYLKHAPPPPKDYGGKTPEQNEKFAKYYEEAKKYESKSKIADANRFYLKAHNIIPAAFEARFGLAKTYSWLGKYKLAFQYYKTLLNDFPKNEELLKAYNDYLKYSPKSVQSYYKKNGMPIFGEFKQQLIKDDFEEKNKIFLSYIEKAEKYEKQKQIAEANNYYLKAEKIFSDRFEAIFGLAKTYGWMSKNDLAIKYYKKILAKEPENMGVLHSYADFLRGEKYYEEALNVYNSLVDLTKDDKYKSYMADIYIIEKDFNIALNLYYEIYIKNPKDLNALKNIALLHFIMKDYEKAAVYYRLYLSMEYDRESTLNYAKSIFYSGNPEKALGMLENYIKKYPDDTEGLNTLGSVYLSIKEPEKAVKIFEDAIFLDPNDIKFKIQLARAYTGTENYDFAEKILSTLSLIQPDNIEILNAFGDLYLAFDQPKKAVIYFYKASLLEPENIKIKTQLARTSTGAKNYDFAEQILFALAQKQPDNNEVKELLGDLNNAKEDFSRAINYYRSIPNFQENPDILFKIAQSYQYDKNYEIAENMYNGFLNNSGYATKAKVNLAEIKINKNKPLEARKMLLNILSKEPDNALAQKNLAVSYISTGDNFKSIGILEKLPKNEDINYNLATAYNSIERKDKALELLEGNSLKYAKKLQETIEMEIRPQLAPLYNYYEETGNANALKYNKFGAKGYYWNKPNIRTVGTVWDSRYVSQEHAAHAWGTYYGVGLEGRPYDKLGFISNIGVETFSYKGSIVQGEAALKYYPNDFLTYEVGYSRILNEIDSYMSSAGVVPTVGPFASQLVGRILNNKFRIVNLSFKLPHKMYMYGGYNLGFSAGSNSPPNLYQEAPAGIGTILFFSPENFINEIKAGYDLYYLGYKTDRSGFGGADLNYSPIGSDGGSPYPSTNNPGIGGYFSPTFFMGNTFGITIKGKIKNTKLKYLAAGFLGIQTITGAYPLAGVSSGTETRLYYGYTGGLSYNDDGRIGLEGYYRLDNYRTVTQQSVRANIIIRF